MFFINDIHRIWKSEVSEALKGYSTKTPNIAVTLYLCINMLDKISTFETLIFSFICEHDPASKRTVRNHVSDYIESYKLINGILHNMMISSLGTALVSAVNDISAEQEHELKKMSTSPMGKLKLYAQYHNSQFYRKQSIRSCC